MQLTRLLVTLGLCAAATQAIASREPEDPAALMADLNAEAIQLLEAGIEKRAPQKKCTISNARVRMDWAALGPKERKDYIAAVKCLQRLPSKSDKNWAPGARSRFDDFLAIHINRTTTIHSTGNFLTWHRYFVWAYEEALQNECGYKGYQPYWNWFTHQDDITKSPVYDGSETSLSGDGEFFQHNGSLAATGFVHFPSGKGGGCLKGGPFKDMVVNMGPIRPGMQGLPVSPAGPLGYNPHCLRRDLTNAAMEYMTATNLLNITTGAASHSVEAFQNELQGRFPQGFAGMHSAGHYVAGGDASDVFSSPSDPSFYLHHAMVDRVYWVWQALHPCAARSVAGTITIGNNPPSRDAVPEDPLDIGVNGDILTIRDAWDTMSGEPFCYIYL
ncbi:hypothetical protein B0I35DRAFT_157459 [Stachybotrys elegans]|uniref:Tyrosinase copper-binding domain-containing protein n=1 Tax=Stachybotrys elegans TaxID=80388 RepID=A0A8K0T241_9HYPO|nr:hypothetical protein B0I35DRAFT_157459 [Stachybotrys elegans]